MLGNEEVVCTKRPHGGGEHECFVPGEGRYTWYVDYEAWGRLRTALLTPR